MEHFVLGSSELLIVILRGAPLVLLLSKINTAVKWVHFNQAVETETHKVTGRTFTDPNGRYQNAETKDKMTARLLQSRQGEPLKLCTP